MFAINLVTMDMWCTLHFNLPCRKMVISYCTSSIIYIGSFTTTVLLTPNGKLVPYRMNMEGPDLANEMFELCVGIVRNCSTGA